MRQKIVIGLMVVVILVILWQLKGMFGFGSSSTSTTFTPTSTAKPATTAAPTTMSANQPPTTVGAATPSLPAATSTPAAMPVPSNQPAQVSMVGNEMGTTERQEQAKYISKINELEELKLSREIAETNQAIATAKLATVTAEKSISDLLTKPAVTETPSLPPSAYAAQLGNGPSAVTEAPTTPPPVTPPPPPEVEYTVISVAMRYGKWSAVVGYQGHLFTVNVGDTLPPDHSTVRSINQNGIVLRKSGKTRKVAVVSSL